MTNTRVWEFDRYIDGRLKAEGVRISRANTFEEACQSAASLASPGSVLVLRTASNPNAEIDRLRQIENAALRVASSRRDGIITDKAVLDKLDAALEVAGDAVEPSVPWKCDWPGCTLKGWHGHAGLPPDYK